MHTPYGQQTLAAGKEMGIKRARELVASAGHSGQAAPIQQHFPSVAQGPAGYPTMGPYAHDPEGSRRAADEMLAAIDDEPWLSHSARCVSVLVQLLRSPAAQDVFGIKEPDHLYRMLSLVLQEDIISLKGRIAVPNNRALNIIFPEGLTNERRNRIISGVNRFPQLASIDPVVILEFIAQLEGVNPKIDYRRDPQTARSAAELLAEPKYSRLRQGLGADQWDRHFVDDEFDRNEQAAREQADAQRKEAEKMARRTQYLNQTLLHNPLGQSFYSWLHNGQEPEEVKYQRIGFALNVLLLLEEMADSIRKEASMTVVPPGHDQDKAAKFASLASSLDTSRHLESGILHGGARSMLEILNEAYGFNGNPHNLYLALQSAANIAAQIGLFL